MPIPNLFVIGAARSGTTSLYHYLCRHPQIYVPTKKEIDYFGVGDSGQVYKGPDADAINSRITRTWGEYLAHFDGVSDESYFVDISPWYLYSSKAAQAIQGKVRDLKIIVILRNPAERAFSHYRLMRKLGLETESSFQKALEIEEGRIRDNWAFGWFYRDVGCYGKQLSRYFSIFDREIIKVVMFEDLQANPSTVMRSIYEFLGVSLDVGINYETYNTADLHRYSIVKSMLTSNSLLNNFLKKCIDESSRRKILGVVKRWNTYKPDIDKKIGKVLRENYEEDIELVENLLERRLDLWR